MRYYKGHNLVIETLSDNCVMSVSSSKSPPELKAEFVTFTSEAKPIQGSFRYSWEY